MKRQAVVRADFHVYDYGRAKVEDTGVLLEVAHRPKSRNNHGMLTTRTAFLSVWRWRKPAA